MAHVKLSLKTSVETPEHAQSFRSYFKIISVAFGSLGTSVLSSAKRDADTVVFARGGVRPRINFTCLISILEQTYAVLGQLVEITDQDAAGRWGWA